jgi:nucleolar protein 53
MLHTLASTSVKSLRSPRSPLVSSSEVHAQRRAAQSETLRTRGLKGRRLGKHLVPEGDVEVQLGEDLSENLRGLKVCSFFFIVV